MPQPEGSQLNNGFSGVLTTIAVSYLPTFETGDNPTGVRYIAKNVFPNVPVGAPSAAYNVWKSGDWLRIEMKKLANAEAPPVIGFTGGQGTYSVDNYGVSTNWTARDLTEARRGGTSEAQFLNMKTLLVTGQSVLKLEQITANLIQTAGNWTVTYAGVSSGPTSGQFLQWDQSGSDPVSDMDLWKYNFLMATGYMPNRVILPYIVWLSLRKNQNLIDRIKYDGTQERPTQVKLDQLKELWDIEDVLIPNGVYNTAAEGATQSLAQFWGKNVWIGFVSPTPSINTPSAGYHFSWDGGSDLGLPAGMGGGNGPQPWGSVSQGSGMYIRKYPTERPRLDWIDSELWTTPNIVAPDLGVLATAVIS